jgi:hypothetical protein
MLITVIIHETGHALGLISSTKRGIGEVYLGDFHETNKETFRLGRIRYHIKWGFAGMCYSKTPYNMTKFQKIATSAGGPFVSLLTAGIFLILFQYDFSNSVVRYFLIGMFWMNLLQFICTVIPVVYPKWMGAYSGMASDGYRIFTAIRNNDNKVDEN